MPWIWKYTPDLGFGGAEMDYEASGLCDGSYALSDTPIDPQLGIPVYKSRAKLARFQKLHCPPIGENPVVDRLWKEIILQHVPEERIQFYPVRLIARDGMCIDYSWVVPFDRVRCIDVRRSKITRKKELPDLTLVLDAEKYVYIEGCLKGRHLARDEQNKLHLIVSDQLHDALTATGESSMFYQPEDVPTLFGENSIFDSSGKR